MTTVARSPNLTATEARRRLAHERDSRLTQLTAIEEGLALADKDLSSAQTAAIRRVLTEIGAAEDRVADGTYGACQTCGSSIPVERLEILPYARYCVSCQQKS